MGAPFFHLCSGIEFVHHTVISCPYGALLVWQEDGDCVKLVLHKSDSMLKWLENLPRNLSKTDFSRIVVLLWPIWWARTASLHGSVNDFGEGYNRGMKFYMAYLGSLATRKQLNEDNGKWRCPKIGWVRVNCDVGLICSDQWALGAIIRDNNGTIPKCGIEVGQGVSSATEAEARTMNFGVVLCKEDVWLNMEVTYPNLVEFFERLGVDVEESDLSFSVSLDKGQGYEWGNRNGLSSLFAQKKNVLNPYFLKMIQEIVKFRADVLMYLDELENNPDLDCTETIGSFVNSRGYSKMFQEAYLVPMCASIWSCSSEQVMGFSAFSTLLFCRNLHLLQLFGRPQWLTVAGHSQCYVSKVKEELENRGCHIRTKCEVDSVLSSDKGCRIVLSDGSQDIYDNCIMAIDAPDALNFLGQEASYEESRILGAFQYVYSEVFLHGDKSLMPQNPAVWSAWNFLGSTVRDSYVSLTYWLNVLQNIDEKGQPFLVTINPSFTPKSTWHQWTRGHPVPSVAASQALLQMDDIQGKRGIWFCGAYQGYGSHEDGLKAGLVAAHRVLQKTCNILKNPKQMVPSCTESVAYILTSRFLKSFISNGRLILLEEGGRVLTFGGNYQKCGLKVAMRIHNSRFYWKVATEADLGLADAYINGDFSLVDKDEGLLNLILLFIANKKSKSSSSTTNSKRGWWTPALSTAILAYAKYFYRHFSNQNTLTQARRNISRHYDLSNKMFSLFLDETMTYSCAVFKSADEDLKDAQLRKLSLLLQKAKIEKNHEVLDIGCGWGSLAIEAVQQTGCKYTGITLSQEQLNYANEKVKDAGLQDRIRFLLCDYRSLPKVQKYDRIISCGMLECVGHEYINEFFYCCDSLLAENGLLVLQFISYPDHEYDEYRLSPGFIKEYIFPGGCLPSLSRVTSAMAAASTLCVEHIENIGIHYHQTLRCWRKNFLQHESEIRSLGFDEKFIRTWEYYFDYCAAGFKSRALGDYQIIFSRPGNNATINNPYEGIPSFNCFLKDEVSNLPII